MGAIQKLSSLINFLSGAKTDPRPSVTPRDTSPVRRAQVRFGIGEVLDLLIRGDSIHDGKSLKWAADVGAPIINGLNTKQATYNVPDGVKTITLSVMEGHGTAWKSIWSSTYEVVAPTDGSVYMEKDKDVHHTQGTPSGGVRVKVHIMPGDVSLTNVEIKEKGGHFHANGCLTYVQNIPHPHSVNWFKGQSVSALGTYFCMDTTARVLDTSAANTHITDRTWPGPDNEQDGRAYRDIEMWYRLSGDHGEGKKFQIQRLETIIYKSGRMYHRKNTVTRVVALNDPTDPP